jgi:hypothetical protein
MLSDLTPLDLCSAEMLEICVGQIEARTKEHVERDDTERSGDKERDSAKERDPRLMT